jgi:hypothetical protein
MSAQSASRAAYAALGQRNAGPVIAKKEASSVINVEATRRAGGVVQQTALAPAQNSRFASGPQPLDAQRFMIASTAAANTVNNAPANRFAPPMPSVGHQSFSVYSGGAGTGAARSARGANAVRGASVSSAVSSAVYGAGKYASPRMAAQAFSSRYPSVIPATPTTIPGVPLGSSRVKRATPNVRRATSNVLRTPSMVGKIQAPAGSAPLIDVTSMNAPVLTLGDEDADRAMYAAWAASVKANGGVATALNGRPVARYYKTVWVPQVNAKKWPMPDTYTNDGQYAYYYASTQIASAAQSLGVATSSEAPKNGFFDSVNILGGPGDMLKKLAFGGAALGALLLLREFR